MCLLIATRGKARPSKKALRRAAQQNPDGFGFAVIGDGKIHSYRSMNAEDTIKKYFQYRDQYPDGDSIFHLRITTHGKTNIDNCHPFQITSDVVMGHNGMLPIEDDGTRSDTRIFAEDWLPQFDLNELLDDDAGFADLSKFAGGSKLAFLSTSDMLARSLYIVNEQLGHWSDGVWYSNGSYKKSYGTLVGYSGWSYTKPTYKISDRRASVRSYEIDSYYEPYGGNDLVWDDIECAWVQDDGLNTNDIVYWTCETCGHCEIFDLSEDEIDYCDQCGTCWYCHRPFDTCACVSFDDGEF